MTSIGGCIVTSEINDIPECLYHRLPEIEDGTINLLQFSVNPAMISSSLKKMTALTVRSIKEMITSKNLSLILHGKYVYNFCRKDVASHIDALIHEVGWASQLGCNVVIHQGKNISSAKMTKLEAINNYVHNVSEVIDQTVNSDVMLLLENSACQGTELGSSLDELAYIYNQFNDEAKERIGFCIDTCHIFVAGELDVRVKAEVANFFTKFDQLIGIDKLKVIHFNDSGAPFGAKRDIHGDIMGGYISNRLLGGSIEGLKYIAQFAAQHKVPLVFETPCVLAELVEEQYVFQYQIVKHWIDKLPLSEKDEIVARLIEKHTVDYYYQSKSKKNINEFK